MSILVVEEMLWRDAVLVWQKAREVVDHSRCSVERVMLEEALLRSGTNEYDYE
jgi:hypothetical protein